MKPVLLCLHGWGGSKESFTQLREALWGADLEVLTPDLPGFGAEPEPARPWTVDDYADWVEQWFNEKTNQRINNQTLFLLGHSHGGRVAIKLAQRKSLPIEHLFLCASAGIRHRRPLKRALGLVLAKTGKGLLSLPGLKRRGDRGKNMLYKILRVHDYEKASPVMRQTMINVTQEDLTPLLSSIELPTDLFWGAQDTMTPLADGKRMHRLIAGSKLHVFPGVRHRVHRDRAREIAEVLRSHHSMKEEA